MKQVQKERAYDVRIQLQTLALSLGQSCGRRMYTAAGYSCRYHVMLTMRWVYPAPPPTLLSLQPSESQFCACYCITLSISLSFLPQPSPTLHSPSPPLPLPFSCNLVMKPTVGRGPAE